MNYNEEKNLDLIHDFDTDTLFYLVSFYRDKMHYINYTSQSDEQDLAIIRYYNALCKELLVRGVFD